jgi:hypothetical protein
MLKSPEWYSGSPSLVQRVVTVKVYKVQNFIKLQERAAGC